MRVLLVEDDKAFRIFLKDRIKEWGHRVEEAEDGRIGLSKIFSETFDMVILDWNITALPGSDFCKNVRKKFERHMPDEFSLIREISCGTTILKYLYIIVLESRSSADEKIIALESGADDYLKKPFNVEELRARLRVGERIISLQNRLVKVYNTLCRMASYDSLTGIYNRRTILDILQREISRSSREGNSLSIAIIDLDDFKRINDTYGHATGDIVLREVAYLLQSNLRSYDYVGRIGGEEFLIIFSNLGREDASRVCERLRRTMERHRFEVEDERIGITLSIGMSSWDGEMEMDALLKSADDACYRAKFSGKNRVEIG